ncbi:MAG: FAD-dependent oxidoreductase [Rhodothermales bacterium]|nr:FAD-dependent oxidoreductase [Rhodothermales bacterium]
MTAYYLQKAGRQVTVLNSAEKGKGTSAGNAGMLVPSHVVPLSAPGVIAQGLRWMMRRDSPFHVRPQLNAAFLRWLWEFRRHCTDSHVARCVPILRDLSLASVREFDAIAEERDDFGLAHTGLLMVYRTDELAEAVNHEAAIAAEAGLITRTLDARAVQHLQPNLRSDATGAVFYEQDGRVDPNLLLETMERRVEAAGGQIHHGVHVESVAPREVQIHKNRQGTLIGSDVVVCAGAWTPQLVKGLSIQPARGYSVTVEPPDEAPEIPMILMEDRVTVTLMPGKLRFGGTLSLSGFDTRVDRVRLGPILAEASRYRPDVDVERLPVWFGYRPASADGLPMIGRLSDGLWVNSGHGMMGVSLAPASGKLAAALIAGTDPPVPAGPFDPNR